MVYWFLSSFVSATLQVVLEKLADSGIKACESMSDADDKLRKLKRTLLRVQSEIEIEEDRQITNAAWQALLQDLEDVAYDADDLLDEFAIDVLTSGLVSKFLSSLDKRTLAPKLSDIQTKLDGMLEEMRSIVKDQDVNMLVTNKLQTSSLTDESLVFGRENDKRKIIDMLGASEETSRGSNFCTISIVGMIGVGKTVLAKLVYNHDYIHHFDLKMWVSVNRDFDVLKVTRSIIEAANERSDDLLSLQSLHIELKRIVQGKKFLLVLDDLWNEERNTWDLLLEPLKHGLKGSKIVVTTRSNAVSLLVAGTDVPYHLNCLSDDDCWLLLKREALGDINLKLDAVLEEIGMKIARKCKGFPLTARSVGRLLHRRVEEDAWNVILQSKLWDLPVIQSEVVPGLRSTCDHLPSYLKPCFAYCSMFPQNYEFEKDKTIQMWMGEGFIPNKEGEVVDDKAHSYFEQLFFTSFFQINEEKYKMQNAIHDLAQTVFGEKFSRVEEADASWIKAKTRHLSLVCKRVMTKNFDATYRWKALRTFLIFSERGVIIEEVPHALFFKLVRLRVLDLSSTQIEEMAKSIGNLKHLRFLDLSNTLLKWLPETIQELRVLQTLRLVNCSELLYLPKCINRLICLRRLEIGGDNQLTSMPVGIGKLTGLKTVSEFIVGSESGQIKELKDMDNLQGSLRIKQLEKVKNPMEALEANLAKKDYLDELDLQWGSTVDARNDEYVLNNLMSGPHKSLKKLTFQGYGGIMFPKWVSDPLFSKLGSISFSECKNCALLPPLGQLPKLKTLKIIGMHKLIMVDETFLGDVSRFQSLETLEFHCMPNLKSWVGLCDKDMPRLHELTISDCPQMVILPSLHYLQSLRKLEFESCTQLSTLADEALSSTVESLIIVECPVLEERCSSGGEDWMKIEHIKHIEINYADAREL